MWQTTRPHVEINGYINDKQEANAWHSTGSQNVQKWQSRGAHMAVNRHRSGPYVAVVQAYKRPRCGSQHAHAWLVNRHIHGNRQAHTWQSTCTYASVTRTWPTYGSCSCIQKVHICIYIGGNKNEHKLVAQKT